MSINKRAVFIILSSLSIQVPLWASNETTPLPGGSYRESCQPGQIQCNNGDCTFGTLCKKKNGVYKSNRVQFKKGVTLTCENNDGVLLCSKKKGVYKSNRAQFKKRSQSNVRE